MIEAGFFRPRLPALKTLACASLAAVLLLSPLQALSAPFAAIVMDARTGQVLWERNADTRLHPASLTKMLTLYIAFDAVRRGEIRMDDMVTVSSYAAAQPPSRLGLRSGQRISVRHLIRAAAIKSANDAAAALGDHIAGNDRAFATRMNRTAKALGMHRSSFRNAHGLTADGHLSTARDMTLLGRRLFYDFPQHYALFSRLTEDAGVARVNNTNRRFLESYRGADGIKTGYTNAAGFNLTASAERGNKRLVASVFGGVSTAQRNAKMAELMDIGFNAAPNRARITPPPPVALNAPEAEAPEAGGAAKTLRLRTTLASSPRPRARPGVSAPPPEMLAEVTSGVADVLASLNNAPAAPPPFQVAEVTPPPNRPEASPAATAGVAEAEAAVQQLLEGKVLPAAIQPRARPAALAGLMTAPQTPEAAPAAATPAELPFQVVSAESAAPAESPAAPPADAPVQQAALIRPESRPAPEDASAAVAQLIAEVAPEPLAEPAAEAAPPQMVAGLRREAPPAELPSSAALETSLTETAEADLPEDMPVPLADDDESVPASSRFAGTLVVPDLKGDRPQARPGEIVMTMAAALPAAQAQPGNVQRISAPAEGEVVSRVSTSGGRHWAVTLGKFNSRGTAERALLQTALSETRALEGALRKVNQKGGGWEATFAGLTRDQADLACRRLQARAINCFTLGP